MKSTHSVDTTHGGFIRREHVAHGGINGSGIGLRRDWRRVPVRYVLAGLALLLAGALILLATETPGSRFIFGVLSVIAMGEARPSVFRPGAPISDARASPP